MPPELVASSSSSSGVDADGDHGMAGTEQGARVSSHDDLASVTTEQQKDAEQQKDTEQQKDSVSVPNGEPAPTTSSSSSVQMNGGQIPNGQSSSNGPHGPSAPQAPSSATKLASHPSRDQGTPPTPLSFDEQFASLGRVFEKAPSDVLRRLVRDYWQKTLVGSDYHMTFVMRMVAEQLPAIGKDTLRQQLATFVAPSLGTAVAQQLSTGQIDQAMPALVSKGSDAFMIACLYKCLATIGARQLVDALASTKRLGFELTDSIEHGERIRPAIANVQTDIQHSAPIPGIYQCEACGRHFTNKAAHLYHISKLKCTEPPKGPVMSRCAACGATFSTAGGVGYHAGNNVCGAYSPEPNDPRPPPAVQHQMSQPQQQPPQQPQPQQQPQHHQTVQHAPGAPEHAISTTPIPLPKLPSVASGSAKPLYWKPPLMTGPLTPASKAPPTDLTLVRSDVQAHTKRPLQSHTPVPVPSSGFTPVPASQHNQHTPRSQQHTPVQSHAPSATKTPPYGVRSESAELLRALGELTEEQRADYYDRMAKQEQAYELKVLHAKRDLTGEAQVTKLKSLKACFAAAQSGVRQRFGIKLRGRRPASVKAAEHARPGVDATTPTDGRRAAQTDHAQNGTPAPPPGPRVALSDMNGGLAGSSATAATEDPTVHTSPSRARSGFVAHNNPSPAQLRERLGQPPKPARPLPPPIDIESSDDSDSDIPGV
ncbi:hypothetical protein VDGE_03379 [Verticillium dahliae]|uniref:C2H2-type domain-containing protein n=1 Tax=Verticillium dahliae TaxID=27337 RepID=A0A444RYD6_VERDA|nr:hypothetical protein VDGE_03379 [Verticillium dahliae]